MNSYLAGVFVLMYSVIAYAGGNDEEQVMSSSSVVGTTVMLYYNDLEAPKKFYQEVLGLSPSFEDDWFSLNKLTENSAVGLIKSGDTAYHKAKKDNAVMLSLTVSNVDEWYRRIKSIDGVKILLEIYDHEKTPIRVFLLEDPGGYTVEVFQWLK